MMTPHGPDAQCFDDWTNRYIILTVRCYENDNDYDLPQLYHFETAEAFDLHRELGAMKVASGTQAFMFETSLQLAVTKVLLGHIVERE